MSNHNSNRARQNGPVSQPPDGAETPRSADLRSALRVPIASEVTSHTDALQRGDAQSRSQTGAPSKKPRQRSTPPYNPELQKFVESKQAWSEPLSENARAKGFRGWRQRGYLPHYDAPGVTQILTLRLVDSFPACRRSEWEGLLRIENDRERRQRLEAYLDLGYGGCWLRQPAIAKFTEDALLSFDGQRYQLAAWAIMPNHIHVLVELWEIPLWQLIKSWKGFIARQANLLLGRRGEFWQREYLESVIEDEDHLRKATRYIENNPVKAKLILDPKGWAWSSARFRDAHGALKYPPRSADLRSALRIPIAGEVVSHTDALQLGDAQSRSQTGAPPRFSAI